MNFKERIGAQPVMIFVLISILMFLADSDAQVTFSRDWNPGKRAPENPEFHTTLKTATDVCHLLLNQIRLLASCEMKSEDVEAGSMPIFTGKRR